MRTYERLLMCGSNYEINANIPNFFKIRPSFKLCAHGHYPITIAPFAIPCFAYTSLENVIIKKHLYSSG